MLDLMQKINCHTTIREKICNEKLATKYENLIYNRKVITKSCADHITLKSTKNLPAWKVLLLASS